MKILATLILLTSFQLSAQTDSEAQKHEKFKKGILEALDNKIKDLTHLRTCYANSKNKDDSKKCREELTAIEEKKNSELREKRKVLNERIEKRLPGKGRNNRSQN